MRTIRRILVAVKDPQAKSLPGVAKAIQLARAFGAKVELFHDLNTPIYIDMAGPEDEGYQGMLREVHAKSLRCLDAIAARMRKHGVAVTTAAEWDFPPYEAIVRRATRIKADLIVAECQPGRRFAPILLRLTDWELLRYSPVPVLIVKNTRPYRHPVVLAAIDPSHAHAKPSKLDDEVLKAGAAIQTALRGKLHAVHSYLPMPIPATPQEIVSANMVTRMVEDIEKAARGSFDRALRNTKIPRVQRHLVPFHPQDAIPRTARATRAAIVVMGAVSRSGLKRIFIGNTAEAVLDDLACDVLVVKPARFANRVPRAKQGAQLITGQPLVLT